MKLNRKILELMYGLPSAELSDEFPTETTFNPEATKLPDGVHVYSDDFENITPEVSKSRLDKGIKRPLTIRVNQKIDCPNKPIFEKFIDFILSEDIELHFVLPPFHPAFYESLITRPQYNFVIEFEQYLVDLAASKEITIHGSYNPAVVGCDSTDYFDDAHLKVKGLEKIF